MAVHSLNHHHTVVQYPVDGRSVRYFRIRKIVISSRVVVSSRKRVPIAFSSAPGLASRKFLRPNERAAASEQSI